jgi:hypothetical protein
MRHSGKEREGDKEKGRRGEGEKGRRGEAPLFPWIFSPFVNSERLTPNTYCHVP